MNVGFIGLGVMSEPMAAHLAEAGHHITGDQIAELIEEFEVLGTQLKGRNLPEPFCIYRRFNSRRHNLGWLQGNGC